MTLSQLLSGFILFGLTLTCIWSQLSAMSYWVSAALFVLLLGIQKSKLDERVFIFQNPGKPSILSGLLGAIYLLPLSYFFATSYNIEFPFFGDHSHHVLTGWNVLLFWREYGLLIFGFGLGVALVHWQWRISWWPILAFGVMVLASSGIGFTPFFGRYPSSHYTTGVPFLILWEIFGGKPGLNPSRWVTVLGVVAWLFVWRPLIFRRWPDLRVAPIAFFFFYQFEVVYFATSNYLDVSGLLLVLLGLEAAWTEREERPWLGVLLCGLATIFKEQAVYSVPVAALVGYFHRKERWKEGLLVTVTSLAPFVVYYCFRSQVQDRPVIIGSLEKMVTSFRVRMYFARAYSQFTEAGLACLACVAVLWGWAMVKRPAWRLGLIVAAASAVGIEVMTFMDVISIAWTGYSRFHFISLGIATFGLWMLSHEWATQGKTRLLAGVSVAFMLLQGEAFLEKGKFLFRSEYDRTFVEHFDTPIYLPIRQLIEKGEKEGLLVHHESKDAKPQLQDIIVIEPVGPIFFPGGVFIGYRDLMERYRLLGVEKFSLDTCSCEAGGPPLMVPLVYEKGGLLRDFPVEYLPAKQQKDCSERARASCEKVIEAHAPDGTVVGILAVKSGSPTRSQR